ncbi:polycystin-2-like isoform X2 [Symsagittifera roscoffensis]|uniref:polycystin-2-like isoform X2 n=1 Tax=Symsagittifera roscoffensis TaxID=84072 RepID=UPI00307CAAD7
MQEDFEFPRPDSSKSLVEPGAAQRREQREREKNVEAQQDDEEYKPKQFCTLGKKVLYTIWRTRLTLPEDSTREAVIRTTLRELVVYCLFLSILCIITYGMFSSSMYYFTNVLMVLFLDQTHGSASEFRSVATINDFWGYVEGPLLNGLYWEEWYNGEELADDEKGYIYYENKIMGLARLRQVKVRNDTCDIPADFENEIKECFAAYAPANEDISDFGLGNGTAWTYSTSAELDGATDWGTLTKYEGGGYYQDLPPLRADAEQVIQELKSGLWVDRGTRAIFIDFTVYNANINLFCVITLRLEFPPTGGAIPSWQFRTVKLIRYVSAFDRFVYLCEVLFILFIIYYIIEEVLEIQIHKINYFRGFWNILDIVIIALSMVGIVYSIYRERTVQSKLETLIANSDTYGNFYWLGYLQTQFNNALAVVVFFAWVKLFKYISFNKTMTQLQTTLSRCAKDIAGFLVMFLIVFLAYAQLSYLVFGTQVKDFSTFKNCIFTLFRIILGDFDFYALEAANRVLGPIVFLTYVFFVFFVLLNMFLAIINDTYSEVKADLASQKSEIEISDYFKKGLNKAVARLTFKHDRLADIQKAIGKADINNDNRLDFNEWRAELKKNGHSDAEIRAMFAEYDVDADGVLSAEEQRQMQACLEGQKDELQREIQDAKQTGPDDEEGRPKSRGRSARSGDGDEDDESESGSDDDSSLRGASRGGGGGGSHSGGGRGGVPKEEFNVLARRVDRMEHSIGSIVSKIDAVLVKLEAMEKMRLKRKETMGKLLDHLNEQQNPDNEQMEQLVRQELEQLDADKLSVSNGSQMGQSANNSGGFQSKSPSALSRRSRVSPAPPADQ